MGGVQHAGYKGFDGGRVTKLGVVQFCERGEGIGQDRAKRQSSEEDPSHDGTWSREKAFRVPHLLDYNPALKRRLVHHPMASCKIKDGVMKTGN